MKEPNKSDWHKLCRFIKYLNGTRDKYLTLSIDTIEVMKSFIDASFAVHPDFRSHTGAEMTMGRGTMIPVSKKQKLNTKSSTEAELVGVDDVSVYVLWTMLFIEEQGYKVEKNIIYQDNKSAMLLEENGRKSAGKCSRVINIRYFWMTDQIKKGNVQVQYCPTDLMRGDLYTKPLQGKKFRNFRKQILGED